MTRHLLTVAVIAATVFARGANASPLAEAPAPSLGAAAEATPVMGGPSPGAPVSQDVNEIIATMQREIDRLRIQTSEQRDRVAVVEAGLADERERRFQEAEEALARRSDLTATLSSLVGVEQTMATGSSEVSDHLARAQATAASVASSAAAAGSTMESVLASEAKSLLERSRRALNNGDLFQARCGVQRAIAALRAAALANPGASS